MTPSEVIARLRELHAKATAGEWVIWGLKSRHGHLTIGIEKETGPAKHICEMAWLRDLREQGASGGDDAAAIVAAMNSLPALLECASVLELLVGSIDAAQFEGLHDAIANEDAERMKDLLTRRILHHEHDARAALDALAEGGGE
jgi:hypothetical protein